MKIAGTCRVVDALREWGLHNTAWRVHRTIVDPSEAIELVLTYYGEIVAPVFGARPTGCMTVEISADDLPLLRLHDGRAADSLIGLYTAEGEKGDYVRAMANGDARVLGPLTSTCQATTDGGEIRLQPPLLVFDGWNRFTAWLIQQRSGRRYPIVVNVILTERTATW